jgi:Protein of unknown function (DUF3237)
MTEASDAIAVKRISERYFDVQGARREFEETYVRTTPKYETSDERCAWLNELVIVGHNELSEDRIENRQYRVL